MPSTKAQRSRTAYIAAFVVLGAVTLLGFAAPLAPQSLLLQLAPTLEAVRENAWAPVAAIAVYVVLATLGAPQIVLITSTVVAFGPWAGLFYSWVAKLIACSVGFVVGRRFGAQILRQHAGPRLTELMAQLARRGFLASALIRLVPTVPSVLVNIAAGATPIAFRDFLAGTALGSVPKMALMAFGGHAAIVMVQRQSLWALGALVGIVLLWAVLAWVGRTWLRRGPKFPPSAGLATPSPQADRTIGEP